ncbi:MAG TPA: hypothetical protein VGO93_19960 [Candidatus Xenobia bacterium]
MRFLQTAAWQIGQGFPGLGEGQAAQLREARFGTVAHVLGLAEREKVDAILVVGNVWADNRIRTQDVERLAGVMAGSAVPVYLLPGESDRYTFDSPYRLQADLFKPPVVLLLEPMEVVPLPIPAAKVGLAWRSTKTAEDLGFEYLALGEPTGETSPRTRGSGTPEPTGFGSGGGNVLLVDLPGPTVKTYPVKTYRWEEATREVHGEEDLLALRQRLEEKANDHGLLHLRLTGALPAPLVAGLDELETEFASRYFYLSIDNEVTPLAVSYRHPLLQEMAQRLEPQALVALSKLVAGSKELE